MESSIGAWIVAMLYAVFSGMLLAIFVQLVRVLLRVHELMRSAGRKLEDEPCEK